MSKKKHKRIPHKFLPWIAARKKYRLSDMHIQMARELGMNPRKFEGMAHTKGRPDKKPFPEFIASLYEQKFGRPQPEEVKSIEQMAAEHMQRREERKAAKLAEQETSEAAETATEQVPATRSESPIIKSPESDSAEG